MRTRPSPPRTSTTSASVLAAKILRDRADLPERPDDEPPAHPPSSFIRVSGASVAANHFGLVPVGQSDLESRVP
jgi:hypothetical protein